MNTRLLILLGVLITFASSPDDASAQFREAFAGDDNITVRELSAAQAMRELEAEYASLSRTKGVDHPDTMEVAGQLAELKRRLTALGRLPAMAASPVVQPRPSLPSQVARSTVMPVQTNPAPSNRQPIPAEMMTEDPWQILLGLVRRVNQLETEVVQLQAEVRRLRGEAPERPRIQTEAIPIPE